MNRVTYLVRHGQTIWNREGRRQGRRDSPLTWRGCEQARHVGEALCRLIDEPTDFSVFVSPLGRTRQTAAIICDTLGLDFNHTQHDERIREISWGEWDGLTRAEIEARAPGELQLRERCRWHYRPPGGESYPMVTRRLADWWRSVEHEKRLIVIAHATLGRVFRGLYLGLEPDQTLTQESPQDAFFRLHRGRVERIEAC